MGERPKTLEEWDVDVQQLTEHIRTHKIARNASRPINRLSKETLLAIFAYYQTLHCDHPDALRRWWPAHICHQWRQLALEQPQFWQRVVVWPSLSVGDLEMLLGRSVNAPLTVRVVGGYSYDSGWKSLVRALQELPRTQSLLVETASSFGMTPYVLSALNGVDTPHLSELSVIPTRYEFHDSRSLKGLELKQYDVVRRPTLREVSLALKTVPDHAHLRAMLHALPQLETLRIWLPGSQEIRTTELFVKDRISMPRLVSLHLSGSTPVCTRLFHSLSIPSNCAVHLDLLRLYIKRPNDASLLGRNIFARLWGDQWKFDAANDVDEVNDTNNTVEYKNAVETKTAEAESTGEAKYADDVNNTEVPLLIIRCSERSECDERIVPLGLDFRRNTTLLEVLHTGNRRAGHVTVDISAEGQQVVDTLFHELASFRYIRRLVLDLHSLSGKRVRWSELRRLEELAFVPGHWIWPHYLVGLLTRRVDKWAYEGDIPWARSLRGLDPTPQNNKAQATLSFGWLQKVLRMRRDDGSPVSTVVLTNPVGLQRHELRTLAGLINTVIWDGECIDMSANNAEWANEDEDKDKGGNGEEDNTDARYEQNEHSEFDRQTAFKADEMAEELQPEYIDVII
ncbi:hypothetical protein EIP86_001805 [Pleurotus ostreatoroseus]|nr:hypothetical protein EIP86_001805 [Pleurotus ostreatoroseus]